MAVNNVALHWSGTTGGRDHLGKRQYSSVYLVDVDSVNDQTQVIIEHFQNAGNLPRLGQGPYTFRNDYDNTVICTSISPKRIDKSHTKWEVTVTHETPTADKDDKEQNKDKDGNLTDDPAQWLPRIDVRFLTIQVPVEKAIYRSGFKGGAAALCPVGKETMVMNSAFIPYVPPPEHDVHISTVRRSWYDLTYSQDEANALIGRVNQDFILINVLGYSAGWLPFTAKIVDLGGSLEFINGGIFWHKQLEIHINPLTWRRQFADRGLHARAMAGDPDGRGGTISASDIPVGVPPARRLIGVDDLPITEPVLFDGDGKPLITDALFPSVVYTTWSFDPEILFPVGIMGN